MMMSPPPLLLQWTFTFRLDIDLPGLGRDDLLKILDAISSLEELEAYGIDLRSITDADDLDFIADSLPSTPSAVHLQFCWDNIPFTDYSMGHLVLHNHSFNGTYADIRHRYGNWLQCLTWNSCTSRQCTPQTRWQLKNWHSPSRISSLSVLQRNSTASSIIMDHIRG